MRAVRYKILEIKKIALAIAVMAGAFLIGWSQQPGSSNIRAINKGIREIPKSPNVNTRMQERPIVVRQKSGKTSSEVRSSGDKKKAPEFTLYRNITRRNSWYVGVGDPITQEEANHLPYYFRLSMQNDKGNYQYVEALHGDSLTTLHPITPYILDKSGASGTDSESVADWRKKLGEVGQWIMIPDLSGEVLMEERAYEAAEKDANLIYVYQPVKLDSIHTIGSYLNDWGYPVDVNESDDYYYGNVVRITHDVNGCDSIVDFIDGVGLRRYNEDEVDQLRYSYDTRGRITSCTKHNLVGWLMSDSSGSSGVIYEYPKEDSDDYIIWYIDKNKRSFPAYDATFDLTFSKGRVTHDSFGRIAKLEVIEGKRFEYGQSEGVSEVVLNYSYDGSLIGREKKLVK